MKKTKVKTNKTVYLGMSILEVSKILMYEFCYDYIDPKYQNNGKLCCADTDSFIIHFKTVDVYKNIAYDVKKWFDTSNYKVDRPLLRGRNKKVIGLFQEKLGGGGDFERICCTWTKSIF